MLPVVVNADLTPSCARVTVTPTKLHRNGTVNGVVAVMTAIGAVGVAQLVANQFLQALLGGWALIIVPVIAVALVFYIKAMFTVKSGALGSILSEFNLKSCLIVLAQSR